MKFAAVLSGDLRKLMADEVKAAERAATTGVRAATDGLKSELRGQITSAGLGGRLARTWRGEIYPKGRASIGAAGLVWSKAPGIIRVYEDGAVIRSRHGFFLAIPTQAAGRYGDGGAKITPGGWERRTGQRLRLVYRRGAPSLLVADNMRARTGQTRRLLKGERCSTPLRTWPHHGADLHSGSPGHHQKAPRCGSSRDPVAGTAAGARGSELAAARGEPVDVTS